MTIHTGGCSDTETNWGWLRAEIQSAVKFGHLNALHDGCVSGFDWDKFFAAGDTLCDFGDMLYVAKVGKWPSTIAEGHLRMCGVLQSLIVIRDACWQFSRCLGVEKISSADARFEKVAEIRNAAIGHPCNHQRTKIRGETFLTRTMLSPGVFEIGTYETGKRFIDRSVDTPLLIHETEQATLAYMQRSFNAAIEDERFLTNGWDRIMISLADEERANNLQKPMRVI